MYDVLQDEYLFAEQVPSLDLDAFDAPEAVLGEVLERVDPPDRFSYILTRQASDQAEAGVQPGSLGFRLAWLPGQGLLVTRVFGTFGPEPPTPASEAGVRRGAVIVAVDGHPLADDDVGTAVGRLGPREAGVTRTLTLEGPAGARREVRLEKRGYAVHTVPVTRVLPGGIGYVLFETFIERSKEELAAAFERFRAQGVRRVVLDLRWNGGGAGATSRFLLDLFLGEAHEGDVAYELRFNERYEDCRRAHRLGDLDASLGGLEEVVIITSPATASASELVWNALRAYVPVRAVGAPSVGKPYGFFPHDFCGKVLRAVSYRRVNARGDAVPLEGI